MSNLPAWIRASRDDEHLETVLGALQDREYARELARDATRQRSQFVNIRTGSDPTNQPPSHIAAHYSVSRGNHPENQLHNRYMDVEPYDRTRVNVAHLGAESRAAGDDVEGRYLNANWVRELFGGKWWIATQAPVPQSMHVFLSLLLQPITCPPSHVHPPPESIRRTRVRTVVQLTQSFEQGRRKAHAYFPNVVGQSHTISPEPGMIAPPLQVTLLDSRTIGEAQCIISTVSIVPVAISTSSNETENQPVIFRHLLYGAWPDHGVPQRQDRGAFLEFIRLVDRTNKDVSFASSFRRASDDFELDPDPPIMVNCSAGVGRTGAFIALSSLLRVYGRLSPSPTNTFPPIRIPSPHELHPSPLGPLPDAIRDDLVAQEVDSLREQRPSMVQRDEQVFLIYDVLALSFGR